MKVLLFCQSFPPETYAPANRIGPMADALSKYYDVRVVTLKPSYPSPEAYEGFPLERHDDKLPYAVKRTFHFHPHKGALIMRTLRENLMALLLAAYAAPGSVDIVATSSPSMFLGPVGLTLARAKRAKFVWDIRDITWGYAKELVGASPVMALAAQMLEKYMLFVARRADLVVGASSGITRVLVENGVASGRAITIPNGISTDLLDDITRRTGEKVRGHRPMVAYAGLIGYNQNLSVLIDAARLLPDVDFVLAGDGPELSSLKRRAKDLGVENVVFGGYLNREGLLKLYGESDILFAQAKSTPIIDATMIPIKLFEYMATGRPIVYAGKGLAVDLLRDAGCAVTVPPGDPGATSAAIMALLRDPERMRTLGLKGRACVERDFHRDKLMEGLARALKERLPDTVAPPSERSGK